MNHLLVFKNVFTALFLFCFGAALKGQTGLNNTVSADIAITGQTGVEGALNGNYYPVSGEISIPQELNYPLCSGSNSVCTQIPHYYSKGLCVRTTAPSYCLCSSGTGVDAIIQCFSPSQGSGNTAGERRMILDFPASVFTSPYAGTPGVSIGAGSSPILPNPKYMAMREGKNKDASAGNRSGPREAAVSICNKNCTDALNWSILPVDSSARHRGFYVRQAGKNGEYLAYSRDKTLSFVADTAGLKEGERESLIWHIGAGDRDKAGKPTSYRILSSADLQYGLALDKKSGAVELCQIFTPQPVKVQGEENAVRFVPNMACESLWHISSEVRKVKKKAEQGSKN